MNEHVIPLLPGILPDFRLPAEEDFLPLRTSVETVNRLPAATGQGIAIGKQNVIYRDAGRDAVKQDGNFPHPRLVILAASQVKLNFS
jgi:hypothetical protein